VRASTPSHITAVQQLGDNQSELQCAPSWFCVTFFFLLSYSSPRHRLDFTAASVVCACCRDTGPAARTASCRLDCHLSQTLALTLTYRPLGLHKIHNVHLSTQACSLPLVSQGTRTTILTLQQSSRQRSPIWCRSNPPSSQRPAVSPSRTTSTQSTPTESSRRSVSAYACTTCCGLPKASLVTAPAWSTSMVGSPSLFCEAPSHVTDPRVFRRF